MKTWGRGEEGKRAKGEGGARGSDNRLSSPLSPFAHFHISPKKFPRGFSLIELVVTLTVLSILTLGVVPLIKTSVKRGREQQLRDTLRGMREAIKEFRRDAVGVQCGGAAGGGIGDVAVRPVNPMQVPIDPRSKVMISDCTIFKVENPDHYPPTLETLVEGVNIIPRGVPLAGSTEGNATDNKLLSTRKKVYLRAIPVDPTTGKAEWDLRSSYDEAGASDWGGENVFDVRSKSSGTALNGEKYADW
ncbi:MAG TPA: type II secretion system protein [Pyrinomonadaceae bacterium]|jgi:general secretion pathway protein G|nr:type II secretion system protein [Pyrinomonadaceae bacterium]